jgi:anthranilate 1,2-dioxygenase (deaminating, decarboxylating) large subunit
VSRDSKGELHAMVNACEHRGATLTRVAKGNQSVFTCPFHAWCYKSDGRLVKVKALMNIVKILINQAEA